MRLFCRGWPRQYDPSIKDIHRVFRYGDPSSRLVAQHLIADHRVSEHCGSIFLDFHAGHLAYGSEFALTNALKDYRQTVARNPEGTFLHPGNACNHIPPARSELAYVWNITSFFLSPAVKVSDLAARPISGFPSKVARDPHELNDSLLNVLKNGQSGVAELVNFRNHIVSEPGRGWHPMWAADRRDLERLRRPNDCSSWFFPLGLNIDPLPAAVLMLFAYMCSDDLQLIRPTQLEASNNPHHLPSPPCHVLNNGGLALRLDAVPPAGDGMVREYMHREVALNSDSVLEVVAPAAPLSVEWGDFLVFRDRQLRRYSASFPGKLNRWSRLLSNSF